MPFSDLSVIVITYNEERNIERCLRSASFAGEIILVDSGSTDKTVGIAKTLGAKVLVHPYDGDIPQRERGFDAACGTWLLYIDADEEISPELKASIGRVIDGNTRFDGYYVGRRVEVLGSWMMHGGWYPDWTFRLFRKDLVKAERAEVHGGFTVDGPKGRLEGDLFHYTYPTIEEYLRKMNDYTSLQVSGKLAHCPGASGLILKILFSPLSYFIRKFFSQRGYRDGARGFVLAVLGSIYTFALYAKLWEYSWRKERNETDLPPITNVALREFKKRYHAASG
jgi:glycosyltransferase involved in cell wall biosynthesis